MMPLQTTQPSMPLEMADQTQELKQLDRQMRGLHEAPKVSEQALREAATEFESVFIAEMLKHMFKHVEMDPINGDDNANSIYKSMMVEEYGKTLAKAGGLGIADHVTSQLLKTQDVGYREGGQQ